MLVVTCFMVGRLITWTSAPPWRSNEWRRAELLFKWSAVRIIIVVKPCSGDISHTTRGRVVRSRRYESSISSVHDMQRGTSAPGTCGLQKALRVWCSSRSSFA